MEVKLDPETESRLQKLSQQTGRAPDELIEEELTKTREMLDARYDDLKSGRATPIDGETAFNELRDRSRERRSGS